MKTYLVHHISTAARDHPDDQDGPCWPMRREKGRSYGQEEACRVCEGINGDVKLFTHTRAASTLCCKFEGRKYQHSG